MKQTEDIMLPSKARNIVISQLLQTFEKALHRSVMNIQEESITLPKDCFPHTVETLRFVWKNVALNPEKLEFKANVDLNFVVGGKNTDTLLVCI